MNIVKKFFDDLMIIENNEIENKYRVDDNKKYISLDRYEEDNKDENEYKKNQENKENESDNNDNDDENIIMMKIIELFDWYNLIDNPELNNAYNICTLL